MRAAGAYLVVRLNRPTNRPSNSLSTVFGGESPAGRGRRGGEPRACSLMALALPGRFLAADPPKGRVKQGEGEVVSRTISLSRGSLGFVLPPAASCPYTPFRSCATASIDPLPTEPGGHATFYDFFRGFDETRLFRVQSGMLMATECRRGIIQKSAGV